MGGRCAPSEAPDSGRGRSQDRDAPDGPLIVTRAGRPQNGWSHDRGAGGGPLPGGERATRGGHKGTSGRPPTGLESCLLPGGGHGLLSSLLLLSVSALRSPAT